MSFRNGSAVLWAHAAARNNTALPTQTTRTCFARAVSITTVQSGMVMEVSATLVATITFTEPLGGGPNTRLCSDAGSAPCNASTCKGASEAETSSVGRDKSLQRRAISPTPGMKMRRLPPLPWRLRLTTARTSWDHHRQRAETSGSVEKEAW